ncbi:hypothetical protein [Pseudomonas aeruginosa]|uniref:hypothetical protein n=1 Tax=Pseudomonas aeruginosa TaxID=287 RepID=UPI0022EB9BCB|nr:hypothetical protein [Pseudomonas aeruginosa]MDA3269564.1 hypothetical protein [Pseudomonas aeruginosa]
MIIHIFVYIRRGERAFYGDISEKRLENDIQSVERFINHTHIYDIFSGCNEDVEDEIFEQLAHMLSLSWRLILKEKFPDRDFSVLLSCSDQDYGPTITFFQK